MIQISLFILGAIVGSFLNVVGLRLNSGVGFRGRSFCLVCKKALRWFELIPVLSFIFQRGRCNGCRSRISWQYPIVELLTGIVFVSLYFVSSSIFTYLLLITVYCIYIVITIYDFRHKIIPDELVYFSIILAAIFHALVFGVAEWLPAAFIFIFFGGIWLISSGRAMGLGDAKLGLSIGILLGNKAYVAIMLAFWIGTAVIILYMLFSITLSRGQRRLTMKSEIPFGPFMVIGAWMVQVFNIGILNVF